MNTHKVGETFLWQKDRFTIIRLKVVEDELDERCGRCFFRNNTHIDHEHLVFVEPCISRSRLDNKNVHFEEIK